MVVKGVLTFCMAPFRGAVKSQKGKNITFPNRPEVPMLEDKSKTMFLFHLPAVHIHAQERSLPML